MTKSFWQRLTSMFGSPEKIEKSDEGTALPEIKRANPVFQPPPGRVTPPPSETEMAARAKWRQGMPVILEPFWASMMTDVDTVDYNRMRLELIEEYPRPDQMALALFNWYGHGQGWQDSPGYETIAEQLLWELPFPVLVTALQDHPLDETHLEGAARFFSGDLFSGTRGPDLAVLPDDIRTALFEHVTQNTESDKIRRVKRAFGL